MKRILPTLAFSTALLAAPVMAQVAAEDIADADGNGLWSMEELQVAYPDLTEEAFAQIDTSADGQIDRAEYDAAVEAGAFAQ
ncbi:MAG: EF-hand domain-containing protein [Pseudorhodobacter sp.]